MTADRSAPFAARPRLLDLFCCEGGGASGYHRAGWEVAGVDVEPQPLYPFGFHQLDVLTITAENVEGARDELIEPVRICGTGLGVRVRRHRYFESNWPLEGVACDHGRFTDRPFPGSSNRPNGRTVMNVGEYRVPLATQREVMQMPWADLYGISQAIPPSYTEFIGGQLLAHIESEARLAA